MAIADIAYAHLSAVDIDALANELETIRRDVKNSLRERDRAYIQRAIAFQRGLDVAARLVIGLHKGQLGVVTSGVSGI